MPPLKIFSNISFLVEYIFSLSTLVNLSLMTDILGLKNVPSVFSISLFASADMDKIAVLPARDSETACCSSN